ncbi:MAG TPA: type 4a pilus biogenesis protein PilO [Gaiellaceae bacterium]|nr:type 4a pilus biogenesis protein PilO [Gaiellaceae bacterium]
MKKKLTLPKGAALAKPALFGLVGVGGLLALLMGWMLLLGPKQKQISSLSSQTQLVRQQIADDLSREATERGASSTPTIKVADVYKLTTAMPSIADMPDLLLELDQTATSAGVTLDAIQPSAPAEAGAGYSSVTITLSASGNFYSLTDLLYRLRNLVYVRGGTLQANGRIFSVTSVTLTPAATKGLTADITLQTYVYGTTAAPGAATATPGSTDTTGTTDTTTTASSSSGPSAAGATP